MIGWIAKDSRRSGSSAHSLALAWASVAQSRGEKYDLHSSQSIRHLYLQSVAGNPYEIEA